mmetsp:Transcript_26306/g.39834  ORF Transcript_26306/g.39834 Transcript_26306/m.39834 type:complete len:643 (+) Transcript_26306:145-2073(+)
MSSEGEDNGGRGENILSPVLTAQDRKKRIRQRRSLQQRSQSLPLNLSVSSNGSIKSREGNEISNITKLDSNLIRRRSYTQLFKDDDAETEGLDSQSNIKTRLFSSDSKSNALADGNVNEISPRKKGSLFGRVMQRTGTLDSFTPVKKRPRVDEPTTPAQRLNRQLASPGGFTMRQMLNNVTSPFTGKELPTEEKEPKQTSENESFNELESSNEWKEAQISEILDWSIKQNLRMECHPPTCLPDSASDFLDEWHEALQYWQYPTKPSRKVSAPLPEKIKSKSTFSGSEKAKMGVEASLKIARKLIDAVRGPNAYVHKLLRSGSEEDLADLRHFREYQDAFSSLYHLWIEKIENGDNRAYFYLVSFNQIILFRSLKTGDELLPTISFSRLHKDSRTTLMEMGLKLRLPDGEIFCESMLDYTGIEEENTTNKDDETLVKTDMEALRKAQAWGEIAGADVTIKTTTKKKCRHPVEIPSLYISGYDDCASYFTMSLNRDCHTDLDYPIFLSRMGPFRNGTLMSLVMQRRRIQDDIGHIELRGPILPCAASAIVQAAARNMNKNKQSCDEDTSDVLKSNGLGSHYFVVQTELEGKKGSQSWESQLSYSRKCCVPNNQIGSSIQRGVDVVVWDISRPDGTTFKVNTEAL